VCVREKRLTISSTVARCAVCAKGEMYRGRNARAREGERKDRRSEVQYNNSKIRSIY
jgi:hypothetical protein